MGPKALTKKCLNFRVFHTNNFLCHIIATQFDLIKQSILYIFYNSFFGRKQ